MTDDSAPRSSNPARDSVIARFYESCLTKPVGEWARALEDACQRSPEYADELRQGMGLLCDFQQIGDRLRHSLLDLWAASDFIDDSRQLAESRDLAVRNVRYVGDAGERKQVVFAHARERNVANQNHLVVSFREDDFQVSSRIDMQAAEHLGVHLRYASRRLLKPLPIRILANSRQDFTNRPLDAG